MKCPKCSYLGFETGDRCKNCGYDFSLLSPADNNDIADYAIHPAAEDDVPVHVIDDMDRSDVDQVDPWIGADREDPLGGRSSVEPTSRDAVDDDSLTLTLTPEKPFDDDVDTNLDVNTSLEVSLDDAELSTPLVAAIEPEFEPLPAASPVVPFASAVAAAAAEEALPLFNPATEEQEEDDEPLIKLPSAPRAPLAVRRTPDTPRLRAVPRPTSRPSPAPVLQFSEDVAERELVEEPKPVLAAEPMRSAAPRSISGQPVGTGTRLMAVAIDYAILLGIDLAVVYFTLRMAGLSTGDWRLLPATPMLTFLVLLKVAYFSAFTAVGGQTLGKMAVGTCVVGEDNASVDVGRALRRTAAGIVSVLPIGLGFVPAFFGERRALHDRLAGTRVVRLRSSI